jgi:hypothetical protein
MAELSKGKKLMRTRGYRQAPPWRPCDDDVLRNEIGLTPVDDLAARLGRSPTAVKIRAGRIGLSLGPDTRDREPDYLPTPAEIEAETAKIRDTWSPTTRV